MGPLSQRKRLPVTTLLWLISPLFAVILWLFLVMGALIFPNLLIPFVSAEAAARQLLHICRLWYVLLALALLAGFPIIILTGYCAWQRTAHIPGPRRMPGIVAGCLIFPCIFIYGIVVREELPARFSQAGADLAQVESGFLVEATVWISPKTRPAALPGPFAGPLAQPAARYGIIGDDTGGKWVQVYVPNAMEFSLDQERLYNENRSVPWNLENARQYRVRYTSNFHFVTEVTPIE